MTNNTSFRSYLLFALNAFEIFDTFVIETLTQNEEQTGFDN